MDWLKCNICFNTFNDSSLRPRVLSCGHSFCERCLFNTIQNESLTCPQCRKINCINSVADLPINFVLEGLLKSLTPCSQDVKEAAVSKPFDEQYDQGDKSENNDRLKNILKQEKSLSSQKELLKESAGLCNEHPNNELMFRCSSHKSWVCEKCIERMGDHPKDCCNIISFKEEIEDRRQEHDSLLDNKKKLCNESLLVVENHISDLSDKRKLHISLVENLQALMIIHKNEDKSLANKTMLFEKVIENGNNVKQRLLDVDKSVQNAATLDESNAARDVLEKMSIETSEWIENLENKVKEGNAELKRSTLLAMSTKSSLDFKENKGLLLQDLENNIIHSNQNQQLEDKINENGNGLMKNKKSIIFKATNDNDCDIHRETISHWCFECQIWICKECLEFHSDLIGCSTIPFADMKKKQLKCTDKVLTSFDKNSKYISYMIQKHIDKKKMLMERIEEQRKELLEKVEKHGNEVRRLSSLLKLGNLHKEKLLECKENLNLENTACNQVKLLLQRKQLLRSWNLNSIKPDVSIEILIALKDHEYIYVKVICHDQDEILSAKVSKYQEDVFFHAFETQKLDVCEEDADDDQEEEDEKGLESNNEDVNEEVEKGSSGNEEENDEQDDVEKRVVINFDRMEEIIPKKSSLVFLQFSRSYFFMEPVQIRLTTNLPHIMNNLLGIFLVSNSLKNIDFHWDCDSNSVKTGELRHFKKHKITPTFSKTNEAKRGDVIANYENGYLSKLYLIVKPYTYTCKSLVVGKIEKGYHTLEIIHNMHASGLKIYDWGMVIEQNIDKYL